jgi:hypothetical protein
MLLVVSMTAMLSGCGPFFAKTFVANKPDIAAVDPAADADCKPKPEDIRIVAGESAKAWAARVAGYYRACWNQHHDSVVSSTQQRSGLAGK